MPTIRIRPYRESDYDAVSHIHDAARKIELSLAALEDAFLPFSVASEREDFFDYPHVDVATIDETVVGFSAYTEEELAWLYVSTDYFRQKIGSRLIENALQTEPGICEIEVLYGNEPAKKLYESFGFSLEKTVTGVMPGNESFPVKVYCMHREITYQKATEDDIAPICELCRQLIMDYELPDAIDIPKVMNWVQKKIERSIDEYTVISVNRQKAGYYHFFQNEDGIFEIDDLYVFPAFQNQGIGTAVIKKCCAAANTPVMLYVFIQNRRAVSLYQRLGFAITETIHGSRYIMRKLDREVFENEKQNCG